MVALAPQLVALRPDGSHQATAPDPAPPLRSATTTMTDPAQAQADPAPPDDPDHPFAAQLPPPLPDYPVPPALPHLAEPPSNSLLFDLEATAPITHRPAEDDPSVSLRAPLPPPPPYCPLSSRTAVDHDPEPATLTEFRDSEGPAKRLSRLRSLFDSLPAPSPPSSPASTSSALPPEQPLQQPQPAPSEPSTHEQRCAQDRRNYTRELWRKCGASVAASVTPVAVPPGSSVAPQVGSPALERQRQAALAAVRWKAFEQYADDKERELWRAFVDLNRDGDMRLRAGEVREACRRAGIEVKEQAIDDFVRAIDRNGDGFISFDEWRDFLLLLPRPISMKEVWRYWQARPLARPSMSRLTQDGDVVVGRGKTGWNRLRSKSTSSSTGASSSSSAKADSAVRLADSTNLRKVDPPNAEQCYSAECAKLRAQRRAERSKKQRTSAEALARASAISSSLEFEESGVAATESDVASASASVKSSGGGAATDGAKSAGPAAAAPAAAPKPAAAAHEPGDDDDEEEEHGPMDDMFAGAGKFLLAGGMAGAVSRTATAPFDRLKVYLITSATGPPCPDLTAAAAKAGKKPPRPGAGSLTKAIRTVYNQGGGVKAFWTGNGLNIIKIFPESAIKFLSYESAKRVFAQYWDRVPDQTLISNSSRFVAGGIGGVVSQFCIYPIESLKTRVMSSSGGCAKGNALILQTARDMWAKGGFRFFFRGLPAGLIGVFPYSAIDMSTFEGIKLAYTKWAGEEPGIAGSLCFGAISGGVGASSVYPLNLVRTRLQAQGTPAHPQTYLGVRDAATKCYQREGWRGFYKGLTPTLVKVIPAVAISYAVYDSSKKFLFAQDQVHHDDGDSDES